MKKKILGIFVCTMLIATVLPAVGNNNKSVSEDSKILAQKTTSEYIPGGFIIKFKKDSVLSNPSIQALNDKFQVSSIEKVFRRAEGTSLENIYLLQVPKDSDILSIVSDYALNPNVIYAEPNYIGYLPIIPNDFYYEVQWPLNNSGKYYGGTPDADIDAPEAWDIETGSSNIVIASLDTGIDYNHVDLADNIWNNEDEIPANGIDDDSNGYIDDIIGWDFVDDDNDPMDEHTTVFGHGTWCAGIHSAVTNNSIGVAGLCWNCKTMVLRCNGGNGAGQLAFAEATQYATDNGADVINLEVVFSYSEILKDAINYAYGKGVFICAAAGNSNSSSKKYPAAYENVTAVGATNQRDERCDESDWGEGRGSNWGGWVDVAAPGNSMYVLHPDNEYQFFAGGGTSFAAPHVAGLAALLLSKNPSLSPDDVKSLILENVDPYKSKYYIGTGRINAYKALVATPSPIPDLDVNGKLSWNNVKPGFTVNGNFMVMNIGAPGSKLNWEVSDWPSEWGTGWAFTPSSGNYLTPEDDHVTVQVTVTAPNVRKSEFDGEVKIVNKDNYSDNCTIDVYLSIPKNKPYIFNFPLLSWLFERFSLGYWIFSTLLG